MKNIKKLKKMLLAVLALLAVFGIILVSKPDMQVDETEASEQSAEFSTEPVEAWPDSVYEEGKFTFTAGQFRECFMDTLPAGYVFADTMAANPAQNGKMQLDILEETGIFTDIAILLNVENAELACNQMALIIGEDAYKEDAAAMLEWYLSTFLDSFEPEEQALIMEESLVMYDSKSDDYVLYSTESQAVMMKHATEDSEKCYYVMISIQ